MSGTEGAAASKTQALDLQSLRGSLSEGSLSGQEPEAEASPQSFAALKQAYDFMLPQYKALQTDKRTLQKENEELRKRLSGKEEQSTEMSEGQYPSDLTSRGQSGKRTSAAITEDEQSDQVAQENGDIRVSPCSALDSAINLNDSLIIEKSVREEREKWLCLTWTLLLYFPEDKMSLIHTMSEHCSESLLEHASSKSSPERDVILSKISKIKMDRNNSASDVHMRTSPLVTPMTLGYSPGGVTYMGDVPRGSPTGKYGSMGTSDEDPSDEDIYTSGLPGKIRGNKMMPKDDDEDEEMVRVENAMEVLSRCADFLHQSLEVNMGLMNKLGEMKQQPMAKGSVSQGGVDKVSSHHLPVHVASRNVSPSKPNRTYPPESSDGRKWQQGASYRQIENIRQQPSAFSDPGRVAAAGLSHLHLNSEYNSDPVVSRRWPSIARSRGRPLSEDFSAPLHELSVKYPPMPYGGGSSYKASGFNDRPPPALPPGSTGSINPITIDHNIQFDDGPMYQPCGPPEMDMKQIGNQDEEDEVRSWNAARNPDLYDEPLHPPSPRHFSRSDPVKHFSPNFGSSSKPERYLPRSSDRIYDMTHQPFGGVPVTRTGNVTRAPLPKAERENFRLSDETIKESPECPVCNKVFDPNTPEVAITSHVNLHFENDAKNFEVIES